jgi:prophage regulatory protein
MTEIFTATLPATGYIRQKSLIGCRAKPGKDGKPGTPAHTGIIPVSAATLWRMVKDGEFPAPVKLTAGVTAWRVENVREWMDAKK